MKQTVTLEEARSKLGIFPLFFRVQPVMFKWGRKSKSPLPEMKGKEFFNCGGNQYITHPPGIRGLMHLVLAVMKYGYGAGGSSLMTLSPIQWHLSERISEFVGMEATSLFPSGARANEALVRVLLEESTGRSIVIASDNHDTILTPVTEGLKKYKVSMIGVDPHNERKIDRLEGKLRNLPKDKLPKYLVVVGIKSATGSIGNLKRLWSIAESYGIKVIIDDAHGMFTYGDGKGTASALGLIPFAITYTFSKALGIMGGGVSGPREFIDRIMTVREQIFTAGLSPMISAMVLRNLNRIQDNPNLLTRLTENSRLFYDQMQIIGFELGDTSRDTPIFYINLTEDPIEAAKQWEKLLLLGVHTNLFVPPASHTGMLRISLTSAMRKRDIEQIVSIFVKWREETS